MLLQDEDGREEAQELNIKNVWLRVHRDVCIVKHVCVVCRVLRVCIAMQRDFWYIAMVCAVSKIIVACACLCLSVCVCMCVRPTQCTICFVHDLDTQLQPCGHFVCEACFQQMRTSAMYLTQSGVFCPFCRCIIQSTQLTKPPPPAPSSTSIWAQNWALLPDPQFPNAPYCILVVGTNNVNSSQLCVEQERREMQLAFLSKFGGNLWADTVNFLHSCFASMSDLARNLREHDPIILHFVCHRHESVLSLFEQNLAAQDLKKVVACWTASGKRLRVIIANVCNSDHIVQAHSKHVDFVIGLASHVDDEEAAAFARVLYGYLGAGESLALGLMLQRWFSIPIAWLDEKMRRISK